MARKCKSMLGHERPEEHAHECQLCFLWVNNEEYRVFFETEQRTKEDFLHCRYIGEPTGEIRDCGLK